MQNGTRVKEPNFERLQNTFLIANDWNQATTMNNKLNNSHRVLYFPTIMIALTVVMMGSPAKAQIIDWTNTSNNNSYWPVGSNWSTFAAPNSTDTARFNANPTYEVWGKFGTGYYWIFPGDGW